MVVDVKGPFTDLSGAEVRDKYRLCQAFHWSSIT